MRKTILLIEDDLPTIDVYTTALEKADNFKVEVITLGDEAIERIKKIQRNKGHSCIYLNQLYKPRIRKKGL